MRALALSASLLALAASAGPLHITPKEITGDWITIQGPCNGAGSHKFSANGDYLAWCFDGVSTGKWSLRDGDKIIITSGPKKPPQDSIIVTALEPHSDRIFIYVRYQDGSREKWMK